MPAMTKKKQDRLLEPLEPIKVCEGGSNGTYTAEPFVETILFYEGLGVVLRIVAYSGGDRFVTAHGGTKINQDFAMALLERSRGDAEDERPAKSNPHSDPDAITSMGNLRDDF